MNHLKKLFPFLKPYNRLAVASLVLLTAVVVIDLSIPRLIQQIIDQGVNQNNMSVVLQTSALMIGLSLFQFILAVFNNYYSIQVGEGVARDLREALFVKIQSFSYGNIDRFTTGRLMVRLSSDTGAVQRVFQIFLRIGTRAPLLMIGSLILMFNTNPALALTMLPLLLVTSAIIVFFSMRMEPLFLGVQQKLDRLNTVLQENIAGARLVKAFVRAGRESQRFEAANEDLTERNVRVMTFMSTMSPVLTFFVNIGIVWVVYEGGMRAIQGSMTDGQIVAFVNYLSTTMGPLLMMTMLANALANGIASAGRVNEVLDTQAEVQDMPGATLLPEAAQASVVFKDVSFRYNPVSAGYNPVSTGYNPVSTGYNPVSAGYNPVSTGYNPVSTGYNPAGAGRGRGSSSDCTVLDHINLAAEAGKTIAILGATGAGKSSLINLIPRFYDPSAGAVEIDGVDIRTVRQDSLLAHVGIVPQETILFSGSVRDNIRYGKPEASEEEVVAAATAAQAHDFILQLAQGYDTHIEERGVNLSGGQKQRIAIARAIILRPRILIMDDSTSSIDVETETKIQDALQELMKDRTSFVVAQRISTVLKADKIIVIDEGQVAAEGTHAELMRTSPIYQEIYESQLGAGFNIEMAQAALEEEVV